MIVKLTVLNDCKIDFLNDCKIDIFCDKNSNQSTLNCHYMLIVCIVYSTKKEQRHSVINHCDRRFSLLSDTDTVQSET